MEDIRFAAEDAIDEQPDEDDVEMDFGDATGSEGTSEEDGDDDDLENPSNESEEGWQDEDDEDEDNLVENEEENDEDAGEGDAEDAEVLWQVNIISSVPTTMSNFSTLGDR